MRPPISRTIAAFITIFAITSSLPSQSLSSDEKKVLDLVDKYNLEAISFLEKTVNLESPTEDLAGVRNLGAVFGKEFESLGMTVKWVEMPKEMNRAGHLVAEIGGTKGKRILLLGHLDTVLKGERFRREGGKAFGTGVGDMKGGNAIILYALKALKAAGALKDRHHRNAYGRRRIDRRACFDQQGSDA